MAIKITIGSKGSKEAPEGEIKVNLNARKSLDGNIMIFDHEDIDIVVVPKKMKIIIFCKDILDDKVYDTQNRLFKFLTKKGIIGRESIRSGNVYGSLESKILKSEENINDIDVTILNISRWIDEERPMFMYGHAVEEGEEERILDPGIKSSTELGEIPPPKEKIKTPKVYPITHPQKTLGY